MPEARVNGVADKSCSPSKASIPPRRTSNALGGTIDNLNAQIREFFKYSTTYELVSKIFTALIGLVSLVVLVLVLIEVGGIVNQRISAALVSKQDRAIQLVQDSLSAMHKYDVPEDSKRGVAPVGNDEVLGYVLSLAPQYPAEKSQFPVYVDALKNRRYKVLSGKTKALWSKQQDIRSAIGGIDYGGDWWDVKDSAVSIEGSVMFTGVNRDATRITHDYEAMVMSLGITPEQVHAAKASGSLQLNDTMIDRLLPRSAIPRKTQLASLLYKKYSTDPQKLVSFNLRIATDDWIQGLGNSDLKKSSACVLRREPSFPVFEGAWCPRTFTPSAAYKDWYTSADFGDWVVECDDPSRELRVENVRWHARMGARYSTAFYHLEVKIQGPRKVVFTQKDLLAIAASPNNAAVPIARLVALPYMGTYEPQDSTIYIVETDTLPHDIRNVMIGLALLCIIYSRCSFVGVCTMFHYVLESPLCILVDVGYASLTYPSGTELCSILASIDTSAAVFKKFVYMAIILRPFTVPALLVSKAILSIRYGFCQVAYCVTIKEVLALILIQVIYISASYSSVVAIGMHPTTSSDDMTSFVWSFVAAIICIAVGFVILRYLLGKAIDDYLKSRLGQPDASVRDISYEKHSVAEGSQRRSLTVSGSGFPSYDDYLGGKFFSFGICLLPMATMKGVRCRVVEGAALWLDVIFNFNMNGLVSYHQVLRPGFIAKVSRIGQYISTDIPVETEEQAQSGHLYIA